MQRIPRILLALLLFVTFTPILFAQGIITGTVSGSVVDATGAVIPNAVITIKDYERGTTFTTTSHQDGTYSFQSLPIGGYSLEINSPGFSSSKVNLVRVTSGNDNQVGKQTLTIGSTQGVTVESSANGAELNTTQSQVSTTFDTTALESLPLGNGFDEVALLVPGVVQTHDLNFSNTNGAAFSSNGARGRSNNFELDGQSNNDNSVAGPQVFFGNQDAIAEIQVIQSNFSAQYGRNTGSVVNYITKSGTNHFHGTAFELYTGSFLSSYPNQFKNQTFGYCTRGQDPATTGCNPIQRLPRAVDNKYGATIGGPILKDKLWAFGSTYFQHTRNGVTPFGSGGNLTPTPAGIAQLAALFPNNPAVSILQNYGPYGIKLGNPKPVQGGTKTEKVFAPNGTAVFIPVAPVQRIAPSGNYSDQEDLGRIDYQVTPKDRLFIRYLYQTTNSLNNPYSPAGGSFYDVPDATHSVGADLTHTFSSQWVNQLRYSFQQSKLDFQSGSFPGCTVNTLTACPGNVSFFGNDVGFGEATNLPQGRTVKVTQFRTTSPSRAASRPSSLARSSTTKTHRTSFCPTTTVPPPSPPSTTSSIRMAISPLPPAAPSFLSARRISPSTSRMTIKSSRPSPLTSVCATKSSARPSTSYTTSA